MSERAIDCATLRDAKQFASDRVIAQDVRRKIEELNEAILAAQAAGLFVNFGITSYPDSPRCTKVGEVWIERPFDLSAGKRSVRL